MIKIPKSHRISFNQIQHTQMYVCENEIENENENENISVHSAKIAKQSITWNKFHTVLFSYCFVKKKIDNYKLDLQITSDQSNLYVFYYARYCIEFVWFVI